MGWAGEDRVGWGGVMWGGEGSGVICLCNTATLSTQPYSLQLTDNTEHTTLQSTAH